MKLIIITLLILLSGTVYSQTQILLEVSAGEYARENTPLFFDLPEAFRKRGYISLTREDTGYSVDVQVLDGKVPSLTWLLQERIGKGEKRRYKLKIDPDKEEASKDLVVCEKNDANIIVSVFGDKVLQYNHKMIPSPIEDEPFWQHNSHIHPVYNPQGDILTDDFPSDHLHQRGIFFAWTKASYKGKSLDFWNLKKKKGAVIHKEITRMENGNVIGQFDVIHHHVDNSVEGEPVPVLKESWRVRVYAISEYYLFDIESVQNCAEDKPLMLPEYKYGGMAVRGAGEWLDESKSGFLTSEGKTREDGNHTRARWVDIHGLIGKRETGITVMCHPDNFRFPQPVRIHPEKPYFCYAPMVTGDFSIEPGKEYVSKYRYYVHTGKLNPVAAERLWQDYASPPEIRIVK